MHQIIRAMNLICDDRLTILKRTSSVSTLILRWGQTLSKAVREFFRKTGENFWKSSNGFSEAQRAQSNVEKYCVLDAKIMEGSCLRLLLPFGIRALRPASVDDSVSAVWARCAGFLRWYGLLASRLTGFFVWTRWLAGRTTEDWRTGWTVGRDGNVSSVALLTPDTGATSYRNDQSVG